MELVDGIAWTDEDRALVYASRRRPNPANLRGLVSQISSVRQYSVPLVEAEWAAQVRYYCETEARAVERMRTQLASNPAHWRPAVEAAIERATTDLSGPLAVDVEAVLVALEVVPVFAALPYWISREGVAFALCALVRSHQIIGDVKLHGYGRGNFVVERPWANHDSGNAWGLLRGALAEAIEPAYDEALLAADRLRLEVAPMLRGLLAFAFPDETEWAVQAGPGMIEIAESTAKGHTPALARYTSVAPLEVANRIVGCTTNTALDRGDLLTMLAFHGAAGGAKVIDTAVRAASSHDIRRVYARVLISVHTPEATEILRKLGGFAPNALMPIFRMHTKAMAKAAKPARAKK